MEIYVKALMGKLEKGLDNHDPALNQVRQYENWLRLTASCIEELKDQVKGHPFIQIEEEINYFKRTIPFFYGKYFFLTKAVNLEIFRKRATKGTLKAYMKMQLRQVERFYRKHAEFIRYYEMEYCYLDDKYFVRANPANQDGRLMGVIISEDLCTASYRLAWVMANDQYKILLEKELRVLDQEETGAGEQKKYEFKGSGADATEIVDAWHKMQIISINGSNATLKDIKEMWEGFFGTHLGNISEKKRINHARKKEKTPFLNRMIKVLEGGG